MTDRTFTFPWSRILEFNQNWGKGDYAGMRKGQAFYTFMELHKSTQHKKWFDLLYNEPNDEVAYAMIMKHADMSC